MDEKPNKYEQLPIPTYEEATSSRPSSRLGPSETSDDAERQGLLGRSDSPPPHTNYAAPTVESQRSSLDSLGGLDPHVEDGEVRREMEEMDMDDPNSDHGAHRSLLRYPFKRFTSFTNSLPSLRLPSFRKFLPSVSLPHVDWEAFRTSRFIILGRVFGILIIVFVVYIIVASDLLALGRGRMTETFDPELVRQHVQQMWKDSSHIGMHLKKVTEYPHMAGTEGSYVLGEYIAEVFKDSKLENVDMERFDVYLNYPRKDGRRVAIVSPPELVWEAQLEEEHEETLVFHGHSKSGNVIGPLIYANYGSRDDFKKLKEMGISVAGAVVLVRYYGTEPDRALKVKAAELEGAVGCIIYSDPINENSLEPNQMPGRFLPFDGVQRGAVSLMSWVVGDVLSPGWASTPGDRHRLSPEESEGLVKIPSIPLSWKDAEHLLNALRGHGQKQDGGWAGVPGVEYWTGDQNSPHVNLKNLQDEETYQPIYNVLGRIHGMEQSDKKIIIGNHRDAWCLGAADPGSGTAILLHLVKVFADLRENHWRPLRTIEFASWDGEEYNLIGSTEHVENRMDELRRNGIIYINVDTAVTGINLKAGASPVFNTALRRAIARVEDPGRNKTVKDVWDETNQQLGTLGAGSDFVAFQDIVGTSSIDLEFSGDKQFPYHSCSDNFDWMEKYGDPSWEYSAALGEILSLLILEFSDSPLLPYDIVHYADSIDKYINDLEKDVGKYINNVGADIMKAPSQLITFLPLRNSLDYLRARIKEVASFDQKWMSLVYGSGGYEPSLLTVKREDRNNRLANFESNLLDLSDGGGLVNRTQFKHVIYAPETWSGYEGETFPSIRQWMVLQDWPKLQKEVLKVSQIIMNAAKELI